MTARLRDGFGRRFEYLRLSLTEVCNFRCQYCLPDGYHCDKDDKPQELSLPELRRLIAGFAALGVWKLRLTGGEPSVRRDFAEVLAMAARVPGIRRVAMTTNGYRLAERIVDWHARGLGALNVSVDSLDPRRFADITGQDRLPEILRGIDLALGLSMPVKVNSVLLKALTDQELGRFLTWIKDTPLSLRFIELMQTGDNGEFFREHHLPASWIENQLLAAGFSERPREPGAGPAREFSHPDYAGRIGLIAPYAKDFCASCNRLRVSSEGQLRLCLFGDGGYDLRPWLRDDEQGEALQEQILGQLGYKAAGHRLHEGYSGSTRHLASIGG
ncbi:MAG: GTP 3',8-cyclase MoaA [Gammaproteobacteria bacterium]|nr:GTP 3',8-cyclase MoaA [Gammaproteobacteria bacterium]